MIKGKNKSSSSPKKDENQWESKIERGFRWKDATNLSFPVLIGIALLWFCYGILESRSNF